MPTYQVMFMREQRLYYYVQADSEKDATAKACNLPESEGEITEVDELDWNYEGTYICDENGTPV